MPRFLSKRELWYQTPPHMHIPSFHHLVNHLQLFAIERSTYVRRLFMHEILAASYAQDNIRVAVGTISSKT